MSALLDLHPDAGHPAVAGAFEVHDVLDALDVSAPMSPAEHATAVAEWQRVVSRVEALKLRLIAGADRAGVAAEVGASGTDAWLRRQTHVTSTAAARQVTLATELSQGHLPTNEALDEGVVSPAHAAVIVHATSQLPTTLTPLERDRVETALVEQARSLDPSQLRRAARRALEAVTDDRTEVDAHEDSLLRDEEERARARTRLTLHDNEDGTVSGHFTVPQLAGDILRKVLDTMTAPRRAALGAPRAQGGFADERTDWAHARGLAFCELLEHLPTDHLHGKVAATVVVTLEHSRLVGALGAAGMDTGSHLSAGEARRLACGAGILPAVLDGVSLPLDLGRTQRLFSEAQRVALATRHTTCSADGCERPFAWCELHHQISWKDGGRTDLAQAIPLCHFHHRRIHDPAYGRARLPDGGIRFHRRT